MALNDSMKVFLSHSHTDAPLAARISAALEENGLEVWDSDRDLLPGDNWAGETARALENSEAMIVLLTPAAVKSRHVKREIEYALGARNYSNRLIPVLVGNSAELPSSELPWIVRRMPLIRLKDSEAGHPQVKRIAEAILGRD